MNDGTKLLKRYIPLWDNCIKKRELRFFGWLGVEAKRLQKGCDTDTQYTTFLFDFTRSSQWRYFGPGGSRIIQNYHWYYNQKLFVKKCRWVSGGLLRILLTYGYVILQSNILLRIPETEFVAVKIEKPLNFTGWSWSEGAFSRAKLEVFFMTAFWLQELQIVLIFKSSFREWV